MQTDALLISVKPEYAEKIFAGVKTVELRRTRPRLLRGDLVLIYVTSPVKALTGICEVAQVIEGTPAALWEALRTQAGISAEVFHKYYSDAAVGYGICLKSASRLARPVHLDLLRAEWPGFHPPQCYRYLTPQQVGLINACNHQEPSVAKRERTEDAD
jgi:predicted transcriptional regulator